MRVRLNGNKNPCNGLLPQGSLTLGGRNQELNLNLFFKVPKLARILTQQGLTGYYCLGIHRVLPPTLDG
jgi:hypothetical protein